jgi:hypothetical protein
VLPAAPQFTPQQLLDAGHRAEGDGRHDYATQFYQQLTEQYPYTTEAAEARGALARLGAGARQSQVWHTNGNSADPVDGASRGAGRGVRRIKYPAPRSHYRTGRMLAVLFSTVGWLIVLAGVAMPLLYMVAGALPLPYGLAAVAGGAIGAVVLGLLIVCAGQMARALFDQANATRELVAIERARANGSVEQR